VINVNKSIKKNIPVILLFTLSILIIISGNFLKQSINLHGLNIHVFILTVMQMIGVAVCVSISLYGLKTFFDTTNKTSLWLSFIFIAIGILDFFHLITFLKMPIFISDRLLEESAWFWLAARSITSIGLVYLSLSEDKKDFFKKKRILAFHTFFYLAIIIAIIYFINKEFPILMMNNRDSSNMVIEYFNSFLILIAIMFFYKKYQQTKQTSEIELVVASILLLLSEMTLTISHEISFFYVVIGYLFRLAGYTYILKAYFLSRQNVTLLQRQVEEKYMQGLIQSFFEHTHDSIKILDINGKVLAVNAGFEKMYGWKEDEVKGRRVRELMPDSGGEIDRIVEEVALGKSFIAHEAIRQRKDGTEIIINMTVSPIKNKFGKIVQMATISRDITGQREAEKKLLKKELELKDTIRRQQGIIFKFKKQNNQFIHTLCDGQLLYELNNRTEQIADKDLSVFQSEHVSEFLGDYYEQAWQGNDITFEAVLSERICVITLRPIKSENEVIEVIGSCMDITQLKKTEELLQKSEKLAVVGELAAGLAHEIRNPLTTLKGFTQLIESQNGQANKTYIDLMLSELERIEMITNEFMAVAKPQVIKFQEHDLIALTKQVLSFSAAQALLKNVNIIEHFDDINATIICEGNQIKQVLINLIKNAIEAMPNGGKLKISVQQVENVLQIKIKDSGMGIPKEILPKLGEPFYTLKEKGTGLGLMVSFRIIESHKGTISFESVENEGTTVIITLPEA
jgi:PAS domain S-box-containing protein